VLRGDVKTTPLSDLLKRLSDAKATGCVYVQPPGRRSAEATVGLREGAICNVTLPGAEDSIGTRLVASRRLTPADLDEAREAQETELATWSLAELLIHLGLADEQTVNDLVLEQTLAALTTLCEWPEGNWRFRRRERTGPSLPTPLNIDDALAKVADRQAQWLELRSKIHSADAVVSLAAQADSSDDDANLEMDADGFAILCVVDGAKTVSELAAATGFTLLDAGHKIAGLVDTGLVQVSHPTDDEQDEPGLDDEDGSSDSLDGSLAAIAAAFSGAVDIDNDFPMGGPLAAPWQPPRTSNGDTLADALARVSAALSEAMVEPDGEAETVDDSEYQLVAEAEPEITDEPAVAVLVDVEVEAPVEVEVEVVEDAEADAELEDDDYLAAVITLPVAAAVAVGVEVEAEAEVEVVDEADETPELMAEVEVELEAELEVIEPEVIVDEAVDEEPAVDEVVEELTAEAPAVDEVEVEDEASEVEVIDEASEVEIEALIEADVEVETEVEIEADVEVEAEVEAELTIVEAEPEAVDVADEPETAEEDLAAALEGFAALEPEQVEQDTEPEVAAVAEAVEEPVEELIEDPAGEPTADQSFDSRASAANAARLLSQFSEEAATPREAEPEAESAPAAPEGHTPRPRRENGFADTAALMRELSGLSSETSALAPPRMPISRPPAQPAPNGGQHARKRKGLFGRG
jgi:hypothetical protein